MRRALFSLWHRHPEYEITLITNDKGKRVIGDDHIDFFEENDLAILGPHMPHDGSAKVPFFCLPGNFWVKALIQFLSQIAFESGFENLSNFNRHFKKLKGCTPKEYKHTKEEISQSSD